MNKKEILQKMNGKNVMREYINMKTVDDINTIREEIKTMIKENGDDINILEEDENTFSFKGYNNFIFKPKCKNGTGLFEVRSNDYTFLLDDEKNKSYGQIPKMENIEIFENGFINILKRLENGIEGIKYTILEV